MAKLCSKCGSDGPFWKLSSTKDGLDYYCTSCRTSRNRDWAIKNPERKRELGRKNQKDAYTRFKIEFVTAYGGACVCCGESEIHFLTVEHLTPEARSRHKTGGKNLSGLPLLRRIKNEGYPDDITVLCANCNYAKGHYGSCPHENDPARYPKPFIIGVSQLGGPDVLWADQEEVLREARGE